MRASALIIMAFTLASSLASAQRCRKDDIDKSTGYCTVPNPAITPGEMDASLACLPSHGHMRQVSDSEQDLILVSYGYPTDMKTKTSGEFDHWYPEWMGGTDGPKNIWYEPHEGKLGSYAKDKVEDMLYQKVCVEHTMSIGEAKRSIQHWTQLVPETQK